MSNSLQSIDTLIKHDSLVDSSQLGSYYTHSYPTTNLFVSDLAKAGSLIKQNDTSTYLIPDSVNVGQKQDTLSLNKSDSLQIEEASTNNSQPELILKERNVLSNDWLVGVLLILVLSVGWIRIKNGKMMLTLFKAAFNSRLANRLYNEEGNLEKKVSVLLNAIYILGIGLFITEIIQFYNIRIYGLSMFIVFWIMSLLYFLLVLIKSTAYKFMAALFNVRNEISEYLYSGLLFNKVLSFLILPILIIIPFTNYYLSLISIYLGIITISFFYLLQLLRGIQVIFKFKDSITYSLIYFFAFEIVPLLILFKFAQSIL